MRRCVHTYEQAIQFLLGRINYERVTGVAFSSDDRKLDRMRRLLAEIGNPHEGLKVIHVAGTKGKGSTSAMAASILTAAGYKTGLYTSPHVSAFEERMVVDGAPPSPDHFVDLINRLIGPIEQMDGGADGPGPTYFELATALSWLYFRDCAVDLAVLEVGLGGRLDATNVVEPLVSVITDISLDHQKFLGDTLTEIAREKAGIIRADRSVVTLPQTPEANDVLGHTILDLGARAINAVPYVPPVSPNSAQYLLPRPQEKAGYIARYPLQVLGHEITVESPLVGRHQLRNIALAIAAAEELSRETFPGVTAATIERGIRETHWPGRFQVLSATAEHPEVVFDVAHNPAGAWALRSTLSATYEERPLIFVFGTMRDKAVSEIAEILFPLADRVIATHVENPRAATPDEIREAARRVAVEIDEASDVPAALAKARVAAGTRGLVVVTGSIYIVGEAMRALGARI